MRKVLEKRKFEQEEHLARAKRFAEEAAKMLGPITVWVYGSVARGDFNIWSDVDVLLVAENLPEHPLDRSSLLFRWAPAGVEPRGLTKAEFEKALEKRDVQLLCALKDRTLLYDGLGLEALLARALRESPQL